MDIEPLTGSVHTRHERLDFWVASEVPGRELAARRHAVQVVTARVVHSSNPRRLLAENASRRAQGALPARNRS